MAALEAGAAAPASAGGRLEQSCSLKQDSVPWAIFQQKQQQQSSSSKPLSPLLALHNEILDFCALISPSAEEEKSPR